MNILKVKKKTLEEIEQLILEAEKGYESKIKDAKIIEELYDLKNQKETSSELKKAIDEYMKQKNKI